MDLDVQAWTELYLAYAKIRGKSTASSLAAEMIPCSEKNPRVRSHLRSSRSFLAPLTIITVIGLSTFSLGYAAKSRSVGFLGTS